MEMLAEKLLELLKSDPESPHYTQDDLACALGTGYDEGFAALILKKLIQQEIIDGGDGSITAQVPDDEILALVSSLGRDEDWSGPVDELESKPEGYFPPHDVSPIFKSHSTSLIY